MATVRAALDTAGAELDRSALEHLVVDRPRDVRLVLRGERLDPARALEDAQRARIGAGPAAAGDMQSKPRRDVDGEAGALGGQLGIEPGHPGLAVMVAAVGGKRD